MRSNTRQRRPFRYSLVFLAVTGVDRPGIIASVTEFLFRLGCNLEDVSMTLLDEKFSMMLIFQLLPEDQERMNRGLEVLEKKMGLSIFWKEYPLLSKQKHLKTEDEASEFYLIRAIGPDQTGIVYHLTRLIARAGLNITDLQTKVISRSTRPIYTLLLETPVPKRFAAKMNAFRKQLSALGHRLKIEVQLTRVESIAF